MPATPAPAHVMSAKPEPRHKMAAMPESLAKMAATPELHHKMDATPEPHYATAVTSEPRHVTAATPESRPIMTATPEPCLAMATLPVPCHGFFFFGGCYSTQAPADAGPGLKGLIASVMDPLMSVRTAVIPRASTLSSLTASTHSSPVGIPLSTVLPVMAVAILSVWAAHCTPEASPVHEYPPEASPVHESAPEASPVHESASEASSVHESVSVPLEVPTSAAEPSKAVAPTHELTVCPVTTKKKNTYYFEIMIQ